MLDLSTFAKLSESDSPRSFATQDAALQALRRQSILDQDLWMKRYQNLLRSRSWKWTSPLRKLYRFLFFNESFSTSSPIFLIFSVLLIDLRKAFQNVQESLRYFAIANLTVNGIRARMLKIQIDTKEDFSQVQKCIANSKYVRYTAQPQDLILYITEDIQFSKFTLFEFAVNWVKIADHSTLYCDFFEFEQKQHFVKPNWNMVYNSAIALFPPIYLESAEFTSLKPFKINQCVIRPISKLDFKKNEIYQSPRIPKILIKRISKTQKPFSIIVPTANKKLVLDGVEEWLISNFIEDVHSTKFLHTPEIIVVHNEQMSLSDQKALKKFPNVRLVLCRQKFLNLSTKINLGVQFATNENLVIANDDIRSKSPLWLDALLSWLDIDSTGAVGPRIFYENGLTQYAGVEVDRGIPHIIGYKKSGDSLGLGFSYVVPREVRAVTGVLLATKKSLFLKVRGWDSRLRINYNDIDYCLRISSLGNKIIYEPRSQIFHLESASRDPSVNFTLEENYFSYRHSEVQPLWPALISDSAVGSNLSFSWRQNYSF